MGTEITLTLNGIDIDWGKNRYWKGHHWLFPPGSLTKVEYRYTDNVIEAKPGFQATLGEVAFRLRHLGYSEHETKTKFESAVFRWNRTANLDLSFADFHRTLISVDFSSLTSADLEPFMWDFRAFVVHLLAAWDTDDASLEDFIAGLDFQLTLRTLTDRAQNLALPLLWHHQDLVDSGWASLDDLTDIDRQTFMIRHTMLVGRLQDYAGVTTVASFDQWLAGRGIARTTPYTRVKPNGALAYETITLPSAVRNMIHHPENPHNTLSDADLSESIELMLRVAKSLPTPLPNLT